MPSKKRGAEDKVLQKLAVIEKRQNEILANQEKLLSSQRSLENEEKKIETLEEKELVQEKTVENDEKAELEELHKLEDMEKNLEKELNVSPLKKITIRDFTKGMIGAFVGVTGHFAFSEGVDIASEYDYVRSTLLLITSFVIIILFIYFAGFRKVNDQYLTKFLPVRAIALYLSAIITILVVLFLFGKISIETPFREIYNSVAAISILAVLGAGTADLIGKSEE